MALASVLNSGFEHGIAPTYLGTFDYMIYEGAPQVTPAAARSGSYGLRLPCAGSTKTYYQMWLSNPLISGGPTKCVIRCADQDRDLPGTRADGASDHPEQLHRWRWAGDQGRGALRLAEHWQRHRRDR